MLNIILLFIAVGNIIVGIINIVASKEKDGWICSCAGWLVVIICTMQLLV